MLQASTKYGDFYGTASADFHDEKQLEELARRYDVDPDLYYFFGMEVDVGEDHGDHDPGSTQVYLLGVEKAVTRAGAIDFVAKYAEQNGGRLPFLRLHLEKCSFWEALRYFKRLSVVVTHRRLEHSVTEYVDAH